MSAINCMTIFEAPTGFGITLGIVAMLTATTAFGLGPRRPPPSKYFEDPKVAALAEAAATGDVRAIDRLVTKEEVDVNASGTDGWTPLAYALLSLNKRGYQKLLELGANPNQTGSGIPFGGTVMTLVAQIDDLFWLRTAVEHGGDVNVRGLMGDQTPIWHAMLAKRQKNLEWLIEHGAKVDAADSSGKTPLIFALGVTNYPAAMLLLESGADWRTEIRLGDGKVNGVIRFRKVNGLVHYLSRYTSNIGADKSSETWKLRTKMIQMLHEKGAELPEALLESADITTGDDAPDNKDAVK